VSATLLSSSSELSPCPCLYVGLMNGYLTLTNLRGDGSAGAGPSLHPIHPLLTQANIITSLHSRVHSDLNLVHHLAGRHFVVVLLPELGQVHDTSHLILLVGPGAILQRNLLKAFKLFHDELVSLVRQETQCHRAIIKLLSEIHAVRHWVERESELPGVGNLRHF
jgi:hypothetical protein